MWRLDLSTLDPWHLTSHQKSQEVCQAGGFSLFQLSSHQRYYQWLSIHDLSTIERWGFNTHAKLSCKALDYFETHQPEMSSVPNGFAQSEARWGVYNSYRNYAKLKVCTIDLAKQLRMDWSFSCNLASLQHQAPRFRHTTSFPATFAKNMGKERASLPKPSMDVAVSCFNTVGLNSSTPKGWMDGQRKNTSEK